MTNDALDPKLLRDAADVTTEVLADAEAVYDGWFADDERIDWEDFLDRLAKYGAVSDTPYDFDQIDNAAIRKIQRHVRKLREQS